MRLETERLLLREWEDRDRQPLAAILGDARVRRYYQSVATPEQVSAQIDAAIALSQQNGFHFQAAELKSSGELVGLIGIGVIPQPIRAVIPGAPRVEIGWQFAERFWGQGLAPEGARRWLAAAWSTFNPPQIVAFTAAINLPSQRVMKKIGMARDYGADFEHPSLPEGHALRRHVVYRIDNPGRDSSRE